MLVGFKYQNKEPKDVLKFQKELRYELDSGNAKDSNAVKVINKAGEKICYVSKENSKEVGSFIKKFGSPRWTKVIDVFAGSAVVALKFGEENPLLVKERRINDATLLTKTMFPPNLLAQY